MKKGEHIEPSIYDRAHIREVIQTKDGDIQDYDKLGIQVLVTKNGSMEQSKFRDLVDHFLAHLDPSIGPGEHQKPCYLFVDGHASRWDYAELARLRLHGVHLVVIPSHTSVWAQPNDVGPNMSLHKFISRATEDWRRIFKQDTFQRRDFNWIFLRAWESFVKDEHESLLSSQREADGVVFPGSNVSSRAYIKTGLHPFNPDCSSWSEAINTIGMNSVKNSFVSGQIETFEPLMYEDAPEMTPEDRDLIVNAIPQTLYEANQDDFDADNGGYVAALHLCRGMIARYKRSLSSQLPQPEPLPANQAERLVVEKYFQIASSLDHIASSKETREEAAIKAKKRQKADVVELTENNGVVDVRRLSDGASGIGYNIGGKKWAIVYKISEGKSDTVIVDQADLIGNQDVEVLFRKGNESLRQKRNAEKRKANERANERERAKEQALQIAEEKRRIEIMSKFSNLVSMVRDASADSVASKKTDASPPSFLAADEIGNIGMDSYVSPSLPHGSVTADETGNGGMHSKPSSPSLRGSAETLAIDDEDRKESLPTVINSKITVKVEELVAFIEQPFHTDAGNHDAVIAPRGEAVPALTSWLFSRAFGGASLGSKKKKRRSRGVGKTPGTAFGASQYDLQFHQMQLIVEYRLEQELGDVDCDDLEEATRLWNLMEDCYAIDDKRDESNDWLSVTKASPTLKKPELQRLAQLFGIVVKRKDGKKGAPLMEDYQRAIIELRLDRKKFEDRVGAIYEEWNNIYGATRESTTEHLRYITEGPPSDPEPATDQTNSQSQLTGVGDGVLADDNESRPAPGCSDTDSSSSAGGGKGGTAENTDDNNVEDDLPISHLRGGKRRKGSNANGKKKRKKEQEEDGSDDGGDEDEQKQKCTKHCASPVPSSPPSLRGGRNKRRRDGASSPEGKKRTRAVCYNDDSDSDDDGLSGDDYIGKRIAVYRTDRHTGKDEYFFGTVDMFGPDPKTGKDGWTIKFDEEIVDYYHGNFGFKEDFDYDELTSGREMYQDVKTLDVE